MNSYWHSIAYFFRLPWHIQWQVQIPRFVPLSILHLTSPTGPHPFLISLPSRKDRVITLYVFVPPRPVDLEGNSDAERLRNRTGEWNVPVVLDYHGGGFIMGSPLEQAPYAAMMSRELGAVVISVSYRIGPFHQFPAAIHDAEDVLSAILDTSRVSKGGNVLRTEIQRYYTMTREMLLSNKNKELIPPHLEHVTSLTLDPTRLAISGFSAGGNIALNMAISVPPCPELTLASPTLSPTGRTKPLHRGSSPANTMSPLLAPRRASTVLDDINQPWETLLPPPQAQPRMIPLLLFYPSLDARLLPHERPLKALPNALKGDDKKPEKARMPGLFSIMGLICQRNCGRILGRDTLAVQSDVWVDKMNSGGWNGFVRFGDGREGDWDGHTGGSAGSLVPQSDDNGGLEIWHAPGCRHGWTQFPDAIVGKHERSEREVVFGRTVDFVKQNWKKKLRVGGDGQGNRGQAVQHLRMPSAFEGLPE
ncbi:hypothetical protein ACEQ8H_003735 [Pleosporales sp. CAS-2024a]